MRPLSIALAAALLAASAVSASAASTTRIETRPYYGAVVTIERGVRVWRPLPPHDRIIIDPRGQARVNIDTGPAQTNYTVNQNSQVNVQESPGHGHGVGIPVLPRRHFRPSPGQHAR